MALSMFVLSIAFHSTGAVTDVGPHITPNRFFACLVLTSSTGIAYCCWGADFWNSNPFHIDLSRFEDSLTSNLISGTSLLIFLVIGAESTWFMALSIFAFSVVFYSMGAITGVGPYIIPTHFFVCLVWILIIFVVFSCWKIGACFSSQIVLWKLGILLVSNLISGSWVLVLDLIDVVIFRLWIWL